MEDVFYNLLVSSDPLISGLRKLNPKTKNAFPSEILQFLIEPEIEQADL